MICKKMATPTSKLTKTGVVMCKTEPNLWKPYTIDILRIVFFLKIGAMWRVVLYAVFICRPKEQYVCFHCF
jgi:hypothetical protein